MTINSLTLRPQPRAGAGGAGSRGSGRDYPRGLSEPGGTSASQAHGRGPRDTRGDAAPLLGRVPAV